nr:hypothetical protein [Tanacetum cinerariifolium]
GEEEEEEDQVPNTPTPPSPTTEPSPPPQEPISLPPQAQPAPPSLPPHEQQTDTFEYSMTLLNTLMETWGIEAIDADEEIILVDMETQANLDAEFQGRKDDDNAAIKEVSAIEPTMFDDEEMAKRLHDEEVEQPAAMEKQEKDDLEKAKVLQQHLKRKPISIAQARKTMIVYLKNMAGYKMEHFKGMTYDKVRPIFKKEYNKVQTLFKPDKDEESTKKRVAEEILLQESFKKLKAVKVSGSHSTQDTPTDDPKEMSEEDVKNKLEIVPVSEFKVESLQRNGKRSSDEDLYESQSTKEQKFGYILQVIKKLELKKLDNLLGVGVVQRLEEKGNKGLMLLVEVFLLLVQD